MDWFDGHLDLAYIALHGRDLTRGPVACGGTLQPASVTFTTLAAANVRAAYSTLFVRKRTANASGDFCFETDAEAHAAALRQVEMHRAWEAGGWMRLVVPTPSSAARNSSFSLARSSGFSLPSQREGPTEPLSAPGVRTPTGYTGTSVTLAMEGAACLRTVEDIDDFHAAGIRMVALAWAEGSRWAGGDQSGGDITPDGKQLIAQLDELGIIHDVSHLSEKSFWTLLETARGPVVASHSNCRALLPDAKNPERHLSDAQIRALAARGGKIGINFFARFLIPAAELSTRRPMVADVVRHITHIETIAGRRDILALGSDMDSGFGTELLPADLQGPADLVRLAEALSRAGWSDEEIQRFAWGW